MSDIFGDTTRAELQQEIDRLRAELSKAEAERDEARREVCELRADLRVKPTFKSQVAAERGWDCFDAKEGER